MGSDLNMQAGSMDDTSDCDEDRSSRMMGHVQNDAFHSWLDDHYYYY